MPPDLQPPPNRDRLFGALILLACVILCLTMSLAVDTAIFVPYNATRAVTKTWQAIHHLTPTTPTIASPRPTGTPLPDHQLAGDGMP